MLNLIVWGDKMGTKIVPAILEPDFEKTLAKLKIIAPYTDWVQFDIMDNSLFKGFTWREPRQLPALVKEAGNPELKTAIHLLIKEPSKFLTDWYKAGASKVIFHFEADYNLQTLFATAQSFNKQIGVAINPETPWQKIANTAIQFNEIVFMAVQPGAQGRGFIAEVINKIKEFKEQIPEVLVGVDGGVGLVNIKRLIEAGADILYVGSAIWSSVNPVAAFEQLQKLAGYQFKIKS